MHGFMKPKENESAKEYVITNSSQNLKEEKSY